MRVAGRRMVVSSEVSNTTVSVNSKNWVACTMEYGVGPLAEQALLQGLGTVVVQLGHLVHADDRQDHLVPDTGALSRGQQVGHGGAEEVQGRFVECRRVRH